MLTPYFPFKIWCMCVHIDINIINICMCLDVLMYLDVDIDMGTDVDVFVDGRLWLSKDEPYMALASAVGMRHGTELPWQARVLHGKNWSWICRGRSLGPEQLAKRGPMMSLTTWQSLAVQAKRFHGRLRRLLNFLNELST